MAKLYNEFDFIGELGIPRDENRFYEVKDNGKGWEGHRLNFGVKESQMNSVFVELYGGFNKDKNNTVYAFSKGNKENKGGKIEVDWDDRLKPEILDMAADFTKTIVDVETDFDVKSKYIEIGFRIKNLEYEGANTEEEKVELKSLKAEYEQLTQNRHEFLSPYDAIVFMSETLKDIDSNKFRIKGNIKLNEWKGKYYKKYEIKTIEIVPQDYTNQLKTTLNIFFDKDALDEGSFKDDQKIYINAYLQDYDSTTRKDGFYPQTFVINGSKLDMNNENHVKMLDVLKSQFKVKGRTFHNLQWVVNAYRGAEAVEISYDDLTAQQKLMIDTGLSKLSDYAPKGGMFGANLEEMRLVKPILSGSFDNGAIDTGMTEDDFMTLLVKSSADIKYEDLSPKKEDSPTKDVKNEEVGDDVIKETMDTLFG